MNAAARHNANKGINRKRPVSQSGKPTQPHRRYTSDMSTYHVTAKNYSDEHENRIHSDDVAARLGFRGALVPGVAVYGHLVHPLVMRYGERWLAEASSSVRFLKPAYDNDRLVISNSQNDGNLTVECHNKSGELLAVLTSSVSEPATPLFDDDRFASPSTEEDRVEISWETINTDRPFAERQWQPSAEENQRYCSEVCETLPIFRKAVHPHFLLSQANTCLTSRFVMPAWIHVGSTIRTFDAVQIGDTVTIQARPVRKWRNKGHEFIEAAIRYQVDGKTAMEIDHIAIYRIAGT